MSSNTLLLLVNGPELRMRSVWHSEVASSGVWTGRRTCWLDTASAVFFQPRKLTYIQNYIVPGLNIQRKGPKKVECYWPLHGRKREERASLQLLCFNWSKFGRSRSFFSTTSTFELSDSIVVWCKGLAQKWGQAGTNLLPPKPCFWIRNYIRVLIAFCLDVPTLSPYPRWHPTEAD